jgi:hypothetical protein
MHRHRQRQQPRYSMQPAVYAYVVTIWRGVTAAVYGGLEFGSARRPAVDGGHAWDTCGARATAAVYAYVGTIWRACNGRRLRRPGIWLRA